MRVPLKKTAASLAGILLLNVPAAGTGRAATVTVDDALFSSRQLDVGPGEKPIASGDVNRDGAIDLLVADRSTHEFMVYLGDGEGAFRIHARFPAGPNPDELTIADLNEDGLFDVVIANHEERYLTILAGDGKANFAPASNSPLAIDVEPHPHAARAHDLDLDGHLDLLVDHRDGRGLLAIRGLGNGEFETANQLIDMGGDPYRGMAVGDVNGDHRPDLITPNDTSIGIALNVAASHLTFELARPVAAASPFALSLTDFDQDGRLDLISASDGAASVIEMFRGNGRGGFTRFRDPLAIAPGAKSIVTGDFNGDGVDDALVTSWSSDARIILGGKNPRVIRFRPGGIGNAWGLAAGDFNGDHKDDFIIADGVEPVAALYLSQ